MKKECDQWPVDPTLPELQKDDTELISSERVCKVEIQESNVLQYFEMSYSLHKILRWVSILAKFAEYLRLKAKNRLREFDRTITVHDTVVATEIIVRIVQKTEFANEIQALKRGDAVPKSSSLRSLTPILAKGLLRVGGRIEEASLPFDTRHPIILPKNHDLTSAVIRQSHVEVGHGGAEHTLARVREKFWITDGKSRVKFVLKDCIICKKTNRTMMQQKMSSLPAERLRAHDPPFTVTGSDCFGPIMVKRGRSTVKRYGVLFTCFATRAVHIELLPNMDTSSMINALRRFTRRRGTVKEIWCDNGSNFVGSSRELQRSLKDLKSEELQEDLSKRSISFHFISPYAPHKGGLWERLVRSVKRTLKSVLTTVTVTDDVLNTAFIEVEGILNSRPITASSDDPKDLAALSPGQLLTHGPVESLPPGAFVSEDTYRQRWRQSQLLADLLWKRWIREYIPLLQATNKWTQQRRNACIGDIVLVSDETSTRGRWSLGRIEAVYPGSDGLIRSVDVRTSSGIYRRPITKLCLLEGAKG